MDARGSQHRQPPFLDRAHRCRARRHACSLASELDRLRFGPADAAPALRLASTSVVLPSLEPCAVPPLLRPLTSNLAYGQLPARGRVVSLAGDYLGYVETPQRMAEGTGETVRTYHGPELAERLGAAVAAAAAAARSPAPPGR